MNYKAKITIGYLIVLIIVLVSTLCLLLYQDSRDLGIPNYKLKYCDVVDGNLETIYYVDDDGEIQKAANISWTIIKRISDEYDNCIVEYHLDEAGAIMQQWSGCYSTKKYYNTSGDCIRIEYYDKNDKLSKDNIYGYAYLVMEYDDNHRCIYEQYYDENADVICNVEGIYGKSFSYLNNGWRYHL